MVIISPEELPKIRKMFKEKKIVFCSGCFDLVHAGHILFFEDCKKHGDLLVVAVGKDSSIKKNKGDKRPILNQHIRLKTIDSLKPIDYCFINQNSVSGKKFYTIEHAFVKLKPDVYIVNEDASDMDIRKELCETFGIRLKVLERWCPPEYDEISTTKIIRKIKELD